MSLPFILKFGQRTIIPTIRSLTFDKFFNGQSYHSMCKNNANTSALLKTTSALWDSIRGMKTKGKLNLRCKSCYFVTRQGRLYVMCKAKPRHKQQAMVKKERNTWILTHATQSKIRPY